MTSSKRIISLFLVVAADAGLGQSPVALVGNEFFLLRNAPPAGVLKFLAHKPSLPVRKLSPRLLLHLRKSQTNHGVDWDQLCVAHTAAPQFIFELLDDTVRLRLLATAQRDKSTWVWTGHEWPPHNPAIKPGDKPHVLEDTRLDAAMQWLRKLDWFMPEPGMWIGDANENFLGTLADAWPHARRRRIIWATARSTASSCSRARSSRGSLSKAAALTGSRSRPNGRRKV